MAVMDYFTAVGYEETVSQVTSTNTVNLGDRRFHQGEEYVYCYNAGGATITTGLGVKLITGASGYSVAATSLTDVANPCVGVCNQTEVGSAQYFWAMVKGYRNVAVVTALTADYTALGLGAAGKFVVADHASSIVGTAHVAAYALGANTGAAGSVYAFIRTGF